MKQGVVITVFVLMFAVVCTPLAAQDSGVNYQTYMVETFDSPESSEITWNGVGSKFITEGYPVLKYFDGMPNALRVMQSDTEQQYKFLGVQFKFNRKGDNWVDIYPTKGSRATVQRLLTKFLLKVLCRDWICGFGVQVMLMISKFYCVIAMVASIRCQ